MAVRVAYVTMQFPVASETFAAVEIRALRRLGADLAVLTYRGPGPGDSTRLADQGLADLTIQRGGLSVLPKSLMLLVLRPADSLFLLGMILRHCWHQPWHLLKALALLPRSLSLLDSIERLDPEVVHLFWGHYPSLVGLLVKRRLPRVIVSQFLGAYDLERRFPLSILLARQADLLLTHAKANLAALQAQSLADASPRVAYRGIEVTRPAPNPTKIPRLMIVAERLVPQKRTADVIRVFAKVAQEMPDARLKILGSGPEAKALKAMARSLGVDSLVDFRGHVPHKEVFDELSRAEVAITMSQSHSERLPNAIKEAMLRRCLCLSTRTSGIEELIEDGETGLLVDPGDVDGAARRLAALMGDAAKQASIIQAAQERIARDFDVDRLMGERLQQWSACLESRGLRGAP